VFDGGVQWEPLLDPVVYSCQENHILVITEGVSTADVNQQVVDFASAIIDPTTETQGECTSLQGSTYLDELTFFGNRSDPSVLYSTTNYQVPLSDPPFDLDDKETLTTHFFVAGSLSSTGTGECSPETLIENAADHGADAVTKAVPIGGEDPQQQKEALEVFFNELRQRASAGSAASVISSARSGEGAIYQGIFWPERISESKDQATGETVEHKITWVGDVHGLFIDDRGFMYEDTNGNRSLEPSEDLDGDGHFDCGEFTATITDPTVREGTDLNNDGAINLKKESDADGDGVVDPEEDFDGDGRFDLVCEDVNGNGVWDVADRDRRVIVYFDETDKKSKACYNLSIVDSLGASCTDSKDLEDVAFLWSANHWLSAPSNEAITANRPSFISSNNQRYIFTWNDNDRDGIVAADEVQPFEASDTRWNTLYKDFNVVDRRGSKWYYQLGSRS
jgi:hypothetical protein